MGLTHSKAPPMLTGESCDQDPQRCGAVPRSDHVSGLVPEIGTAVPTPAAQLLHAQQPQKSEPELKIQMQEAWCVRLQPPIPSKRFQGTAPDSAKPQPGQHIAFQRGACTTHKPHTKNNPEVQPKAKIPSWDMDRMFRPNRSIRWAKLSTGMKSFGCPPTTPDHSNEDTTKEDTPRPQPEKNRRSEPISVADDAKGEPNGPERPRDIRFGKYIRFQDAKAKSAQKTTKQVTTVDDKAKEKPKAKGTISPLESSICTTADQKKDDSGRLLDCQLLGTEGTTEPKNPFAGIDPNLIEDLGEKKMAFRAMHLIMKNLPSLGSKFRDAVLARPFLPWIPAKMSAISTGKGTDDAICQQMCRLLQERDPALLRELIEFGPGILKKKQGGTARQVRGFFFLKYGLRNKETLSLTRQKHVVSALRGDRHAIGEDSGKDAERKPTESQECDYGEAPSASKQPPRQVQKESYYRTQRNARKLPEIDTEDNDAQTLLRVEFENRAETESAPKTEMRSTTKLGNLPLNESKDVFQMAVEPEQLTVEQFKAKYNSKEGKENAPRLINEGIDH